MNILMISHEYPPIGGGGANACMFLSREYAKKGNNVTILTVWYPETEMYECHNIECEDNGENSDCKKIEIHRIKAKRQYQDHCTFFEMFDFIYKAPEKIDEILRNTDNSIDVCQVFFGIPSGPLGLYIKKKYAIPYVVRFGGGDIPGFQQRFKYLYKPLAPFIRKIWKEADALVANSEGLRKLALSFDDTNEIIVIHNGVDLDYFVPAMNFAVDNRLTNEEDTVKLLFVSRLIERKGLQYLIPYLDEIQDKTSKRIKLTIVGEGPYRTELEKLAEKTMTEVVFVGAKQKNELLDYYQDADVFVFPSRKEGMPNVVLEAMACGLPIVMNNCEGSTELICCINDENLQNGVVSLEQNEFAEALLFLLRLSPSSRKQMGENSRRRVEKQFSWKKAANMYLNLFELNKTTNVKGY